ncbi:MAG TPA: holo-ACP synthase [Phycisphaerales bacterium]|nr:holo-ACP synthase [Phycisphaerales bacterium]
MRIFGHGIDLVEIDRIQRMIDDHSDRFLERCFTPEERFHGEGGRRYAEHIAARFAAKEAAMKALGTGLASGISWTDFSVHAEATGRPRLVVAGEAAKLSWHHEITEWHVSLSHTETMAMASVIAVANKEPTRGLGLAPGNAP